MFILACQTPVDIQPALQKKTDLQWMTSSEEYSDIEEFLHNTFATLSLYQMHILD